MMAFGLSIGLGHVAQMERDTAERLDDPVQNYITEAPTWLLTLGLLLAVNNRGLLLAVNNRAWFFKSALVVLW